ncbi:MAG: ThuA domain-containing protein [Phycisphaerales bacterium JB038]
MSGSALFVWGGWEGHEPKQCVEVIAPLIEQADLTVTISDSLSAFDDAASLADCSVIVPCWTMGELSPDQERNLTQAVADGVGLAGWHGGLGDAFRSNTEYQFAVGGQFVAHPGNIIDYTVNITEPNHPITEGLADFTVTSEQYYLHVDPTLNVLATTRFSGEHATWVKGALMPVVWTKQYGKGRVFYCSIGHVAADLETPEVKEMIRRGILWAANASD